MRFEAREVQRRTPISPKGEPLQIPQLRKIHRRACNPTDRERDTGAGFDFYANYSWSTPLYPMLLLNSAAAARLKHVPPKGEQDDYPNQGTVKAGVSDDFCK